MFRTHQRLNGSTGFTLIELLVVISVIALLGTMLLTTIPMVREQAVRTVCAGKLRQIGIVAMTYAANSDGEFPPQNPNPNFFGSPDVSGRQGIGLLMDLAVDTEGAGGGKLFFCPGALNPKNSALVFNRPQVAAGDYSGCWRYGYTYHAGARDTQGNWGDNPLGYPPLNPGYMTSTFRPNNRVAISTSQVLTADGRNGPLASAVLCADWVCKFGNGGIMENTAINHPAGGPLSNGKGGNVLHADGHVEWYLFPRDMIDDWWNSYALWKTEYVLQ